VTRDIKFTITDKKSGAALPVKVITRASRIEMVGVSQGMLRIKLTAAPVDGKANAQLIDFLAERAAVPKSSIEIVAGVDHAKKIISFDGLSNAELEARLGLSELPDMGPDTEDDSES